MTVHDPRDGGFEEILRGHGLSVTAQRLAVLRVVSSRPHATAAEIESAVRAELGAVSKQAVYDALTTLWEYGVIRRIRPAGSPARYEARVGDNHHHLVCRECGRTVDVDCATGAVPCLTPSDDAGFDIDEAEVVFWGRCPSCASNPS
ncbi:Fur family transcriptional regulator [Rhabdothermincola sp.]|uniref:Fur family transcriptional regulator n=1 Tax=Rhabdothermincola sp. TaxID=2820405 RepID=UPI002FE10547